MRGRWFKIPNWKGFLDFVKEKPKDLVQGILKYFDPPIYARMKLIEYYFLCEFCVELNNEVVRRFDECCICQKSICEKHSTEFKKGGLSWYVCPTCFTSLSQEEIEDQIIMMYESLKEDEYYNSPDPYDKIEDKIEELNRGGSLFE